MKIDLQYRQFIVLISFVLFLSCTPMDNYYADFIPDAIRIYPGKVDSVLIYPGHSRLMISGQLSSDPKVVKMTVYWQNKQDSIEVSVQPSDIGKIKEILINPISEGSYNFEIFTFDVKNNSSIKTEAFGRVYGDKYINSLNNRSISLSGHHTNSNDAFIKWIPDNDLTFIGTEVTYIDKNDNQVTNIIPKDEVTTVLANYKFGSEIKYRAMFIPSPNAIDTFYSLSKTLVIN